MITFRTMSVMEPLIEMGLATQPMNVQAEVGIHKHICASSVLMFIY